MSCHMIERRAPRRWTAKAFAFSCRSGLFMATASMAICFSGCGKSKNSDNSAAPPPTQQVAQAQTQAEMPPNAVQPSPPSTGQANAEPLDLNRELRKWILKNRRPPKNFEDFAGTSGIEIPPPPDGKKYAIDKTMHVILVKR